MNNFINLQRKIDDDPCIIHSCNQAVDSRKTLPINKNIGGELARKKHQKSFENSLKNTIFVDEQLNMKQESVMLYTEKETIDFMVSFAMKSMGYESVDYIKNNFPKLYNENLEEAKALINSVKK